MKKSILEKSKQLFSMYITEEPFNLSSEDYGYKYFIVFHNTHKIVGRFKTQWELEERIDEIIESGQQDGGGTFH